MRGLLSVKQIALFVAAEKGERDSRKLLTLHVVSVEDFVWSEYASAVNRMYQLSKLQQLKRDDFFLV